MYGSGDKHNNVHSKQIYPFIESFVFILIAEIEATEACQWLRAAGFPQYAQMYEGKWTNEFNLIDIVSVKASL